MVHTCVDIGAATGSRAAVIRNILNGDSRVACAVQNRVDEGRKGDDVLRATFTFDSAHENDSCQGSDRFNDR